MFVVRIAGPSMDDWKAFQQRADARSRFVSARKSIIEGDHDDVRAVMFHVPGENDARRAIERIKQADRDVIIIEKSWISLSPEEEALLAELLRR